MPDSLLKKHLVYSRIEGEPRRYVQDELRGCMGTLEPEGPLVLSVADNARRAAFQDPRFAALTDRELPGLGIELSLLSEATSLQVNGEAELCRLLRPGRDGLIIQYGGQRATFLPSVWAQLGSDV